MRLNGCGYDFLNAVTTPREKREDAIALILCLFAFSSELLSDCIDRRQIGVRAERLEAAARLVQMNPDELITAARVHTSLVHEQSRSSRQDGLMGG